MYEADRRQPDSELPMPGDETGLFETVEPGTEPALATTAEPYDIFASAYVRMSMLAASDARLIAVSAEPLRITPGATEMEEYGHFFDDEDYPQISLVRLSARETTFDIPTLDCYLGRLAGRFEEVSKAHSPLVDYQIVQTPGSYSAYNEEFTPPKLEIAEQIGELVISPKLRLFENSGHEGEKDLATDIASTIHITQVEVYPNASMPTSLSGRHNKAYRKSFRYAAKTKARPALQRFVAP